MKKFNVTIAAVTREVNANEYSVSPKTGVFEASICGKTGQAWTTSGKGKSAINNHYIYFKDDAVLYYFKSNAVEVVEARKGLSVALPGAVVAPPAEDLSQTTHEEMVDEEATVTPSAPAPKRTRSRK